jgi:hypothetical protein
MSDKIFISLSDKSISQKKWNKIFGGNNEKENKREKIFDKKAEETITEETEESDCQEKE